MKRVSDFELKNKGKDSPHSRRKHTKNAKKTAYSCLYTSRKVLIADSYSIAYCAISTLDFDEIPNFVV